MVDLDLIMNSLFSLSVGLIWFMIAYQFLLSLMGFIYFHRARREKAQIDEMIKSGTLQFPFLSILVPAHNEEKVIERTVRGILDMEYPHDRDGAHCN